MTLLDFIIQSGKFSLCFFLTPDAAIISVTRKKKKERKTTEVIDLIEIENEKT